MLTDSPELARIQPYRLSRITQWLDHCQCPAVVLFDPINIRYATGSRNMQVWTMHNVCRYAVVFQSGKTILFDSPSSSHLARNLQGVDEIRPALAMGYVIVGEVGGREGVKLEQPVWISAAGPVVQSDYPLELDYL